jgi:hypothetical protein
MDSGNQSKPKQTAQEQTVHSPGWLPPYPGIKIPRLFPTLIRIIKIRLRRVRFSRQLKNGQSR